MFPVSLSRLAGCRASLAWKASRAASSAAAGPEMIKVELVGSKGNVGLITLHRPKHLNALCKQLMGELRTALLDLDANKEVGAIVLTGGDRIFAAGADIKEMAVRDFATTISGEDKFLEEWDAFYAVRKPIIAAVNGWCLGGGNEMVMMCDIVYAGEKAIFGQPEVNIGTIPGEGGTQRWSRVAGKSMAMEVCLTGNRVRAKDALRCGIVSKIFPGPEVIPEAIKLAEKIGEQSPLIVAMCKESVNKAFETTLREGLAFERRMFHATFATHDRKEGMTAFAEKRAPKWKGE